MNTTQPSHTPTSKFPCPLCQFLNNKKLGYKRLGSLFDCEDWGEKKHTSGTKAYVFMEDKERQKEVSFVWSDYVVIRNRVGKEPLTLHSLKLVVFFNVLTGYFVQNQDNMLNFLEKCEDCIVEKLEGNSNLEIFI
ncbi:hypothetical protein RhiirA5_431177 [Rhizophagus irregularis]|uniref:Uncharacterized protein n=1 Tax=Rhizophagus irregularis TaxID=588596 RepID=A0A2N0NVG2_9GLOM|nr:hypothetical protein RhiirA5_431177 [Rhizophagus irregularis]PKC56987.1 hypothetical protein RhiirA1_473207 [Rhizophagus irregularis]